MAWRDSRRSRSKLFLFTAAISVGIAALVAINSFKANLEDEIALQAKSLLGADLEVYTNQPLTFEQYGLIDSLGRNRSSQIQFSSMVYFPKTNDTRLVQIRALRGDFPYYGAIETDPAWAAGDLTNGKYALVDEKVMLQFNAKIGDEIKIGLIKFEIRGKLKRVPGQNGISTTIAPIIYLYEGWIAETGLVKKGSRVTYSFYYKYPNEVVLEEKLNQFSDRIVATNMSFDTVEKRKEDTTDAFNNLAMFLNLSAFIALLLGSLGVASAVYIYLKEKHQSVAILRCLGVSGRQAFMIYFYQVLIMGAVGAVIGIALGVAMQFGVPQLMSDLFPVSITPRFYWQIAVQGLMLGMIVTVLFAMIPLMSLTKVSPLQSIRQDFSGTVNQTQFSHWVVYGLLTLFLFSFTYYQIGDVVQALFFLGGLAITFLLLYAIARGLMYLAKWQSKKLKTFTIKHAITNLHRPQNQSSLLVLTIGICTVLVSTLLFTRYNLIEQITLTDQDNRPNMVLFDIQTHQKEAIKTLTQEYDLPVIQEVPVVTMRLKEVNGVSKTMAEQDSLLEIPSWAYNREYRVTFRGQLIDSETIVEGKLQSKVEQANDTIFISVAEGFAKRLKWDVGDQLIFNVQGALITTYIGSIRKVDWRRVQTNFLILFPSNVLEKAPQFHVLITKVDQSDVSARYQQAVVSLYPNVSLIDLELILQTVEEVFAKIGFAINFMAGFSVLTSLIVLAGAVVLSKSQRMHESVIIRTLGGSSRQVIAIIMVEYAALGLIASTSGLIIASGFSWTISHFLFEQTFVYSWQYALGILSAITFGTLVIGVLNIRPVLRQSPLQVLREEG